MKRTTSSWTERKTEILLGNLLRSGVALAAFVVLLGGVLYLAQFGSGTPHHRVFQGEPPELCTLPGILQGALSGNSRGIIQLGLLLLIATPVVRVLFSVYAFARERDKLYVGITVVVLFTLLASLFLG